MASFVWCDGQALVVNLDRVDFIRIVKKSAFRIEFYRSERHTRDDKPIFVNSWEFPNESKLLETLDNIVKEFGVKIE